MLNLNSPLQNYCDYPPAFRFLALEGGSAYRLLGARVTVPDWICPVKRPMVLKSQVRVSK